MLGGVTMTVAGGPPFGDGVPVQVSMTAEASLSDGSSADPTWQIDRLTELQVAMPGGMSAADRATVTGFAATLGHHLISLSLNESSPALPLVSLAPPTDVTVGGMSTSTGIATGTRVGIAMPSLSIVGDHLEATGPLGAL